MLIRRRVSYTIQSSEMRNTCTFIQVGACELDRPMNQCCVSHELTTVSHELTTVSHVLTTVSHVLTTV
jgi:hypothetical protein